MSNTFNLDILQALYDSEINFELRWIWDGGVDWKLFRPGDQLIESNAPTVTEAAYELARAAIIHYPDSDFAKRFPELKAEPKH
jgi:hypothetical protein